MNLLFQIAIITSLTTGSIDEAPGVNDASLVTAIPAPPEDSLSALVLDSLTVELTRLSGDPSASLSGIIDLINAINSVKADTNSILSVRKEILIENAKKAFARQSAKLDVLPDDSEADALILDAVLHDSLDEEDTLSIFQREITDEDLFEGLESERNNQSISRLPPIPLTQNAEVDRMIQFFQSRGRKVMQKWFERAAYAIPELMPYLREEGMPEEIIYLAMIESGFNYHARSYAKAVGPWQFIKGTGKRYGLKINNWYDERRDPELSTRASARYLKDLYYMFGDWYLAMASYNCGERKVERHANQYGNNFWLLKKLPKQTRAYVPSYIAARMIAEAPEVYGFHMPGRQTPPMTEKIFITQCVELSALAKCAQIDLETFRHYNPALLRSVTPPGGDSTMIRLPYGSVVNGFWSRFAEIPAAKKTDLLTHKVRRGESIGQIASHYGVPIDLIADYPENNIGKRYLIREGQVLYIPVANDSPAKIAKREPETYTPDPSGTYTVRSGDNLASISRKMGLSVERLASINGLTVTTTIFPGEKLNLEGMAVAEMTQVESSDEFGSQRTHVVNSGDTLWNIARLYGVTVDDIRKLNRLTKRSLIKPGQRLAIPVQN